MLTRLSLSAAMQMRGFIPILLTLGVFSNAWCQEPTDEVAGMVRRLSADTYESREGAMRELAQAGLAAIPELTRAIFDADPETRWRAGKSLEQIGLEGDERALRKVSRVMNFLGECGLPGLKQRSRQMRELWMETQVQKLTDHLTSLGATIDQSGGFSGEPGVFLAVPLMDRRFEGNAKPAPEADESADSDAAAEVVDRSPAEIQEMIAQIVADPEEADNADMAEWEMVPSSGDLPSSLEDIDLAARMIDIRGMETSSPWRVISIGPEFKGADADWKILSQVSRLVQVRITEREITRDQWKALETIGSLRSLYLERCDYQCDDAIAFRKSRSDVGTRIVGRGFLGVTGPTDDLASECRISQVLPDTAAERAGIQVDDVITAINDKPVSEFQDLIFIVGSYKPGDELKLDYRRGEESHTTRATLLPRIGLSP